MTVKMIISVYKYIITKKKIKYLTRTKTTQLYLNNVKINETAPQNMVYKMHTKCQPNVWDRCITFICEKKKYVLVTVLSFDIFWQFESSWRHLDKLSKICKKSSFFFISGESRRSYICNGGCKVRKNQPASAGRMKCERAK